MTDMTDESSSTERSRNLWAPWRMEYIDELNETPSNSADGCFLCRYRDEPAVDEKNLVLWRGAHSFAVLNRFPYTGGHTLIAPYAHVADLAGLESPAMLEMMRFLRDMERIMRGALRADGFNVGINLGRCAGAGLPGHLHIHIVPRWNGDTNFMAVFGGVRVIPQTLEKLYAALKSTGRQLRLPDLER